MRLDAGLFKVEKEIRKLQKLWEDDQKEGFLPTAEGSWDACVPPTSVHGGLIDATLHTQDRSVDKSISKC